MGGGANKDQYLVDPSHPIYDFIDHQMIYYIYLFVFYENHEESWNMCCFHLFGTMAGNFCHIGVSIFNSFPYISIFSIFFHSIRIFLYNTYYIQYTMHLYCFLTDFHWCLFFCLTNFVNIQRGCWWTFHENTTFHKKNTFGCNFFFIKGACGGFVATSFITCS